MTLDPLTGTCPTCHSEIGVTCYTAGGAPCSPHAARKGVARGGTPEEVRRYALLVVDEVAKLGSGAIKRDDLKTAVANALQRYDYGDRVG